MATDLAWTLYDAGLVASVVIFFAVITTYVRLGLFSIFHPMTWYAAFHGMVFVFRPIVARLSDFDLIYRAYQFTPSIEDKLTVIGAANLGFLAFSIACMASGNRILQFSADPAPQLQRELMRPSFVWVLAICVPLGVYSMYQTWSAAASTGAAFSSMVRDSETGVYINTVSNGYVAEAQLMLASCSAIFAWVFRFRLIACLPLAMFILFRAGVGGRGPFITALATVALLFLFERRRRAPTPLVVAVAMAALLVFNAVGQDRGESIRRAVIEGTSSEVSGQAQSGERFLEGMDFGNLEYFEYLVYVIPQRSGTYGYFTDVLQVVTEPIPRSIWPDKPAGAPFERIFLFRYGTPIGMTRSLPGEGWYGLGWAGVVLWCAAWGYALGWIYRRFVDGSRGAPQIIAYMTFLPILIIGFRDGQIVTLFRQGLFFLAPVGLWVAMSRLAGVPDISAIRAALPGGRRRNASTTEAGGDTPEHFSGETSQLPPAVRRRRQALHRGL